MKQADATAGRMTAKAAPISTILPPMVEIADPTQRATVTEPEL